MANSSFSPGAENAPLAPVVGYKPSGKIGALGWPLSLVSLLVIPFLLAFIYVKTNHFGLGSFGLIYVVVAAGAILGALVGAAFWPAIQLGKVRNTAFAAALGFLAGTLTYGLQLGLEAQSNRSEIIAAVAPALAKTRNVSESAARQSLESSLTPLKTVQLYWQTQAQSGLEVSGRRGREANISGGMFYALEGIEWLLCAIAATLFLNVLAARRFSEVASSWYQSKNLHNVLPDAVPALLEAAGAGEWERFGRLAAAAKNPEFKEFKPPITLYTLPGKPGGILEIKALSDPKKPVEVVYERELSDEEIRRIQNPAPSE